MVEPWETDRALTLETARDVFRAEFPAADADSLRLLGSGWEFDAFASADGWVLRFPRRADAEQLFEREGPILELARSVLPSSVSVPEVRVVGPTVDEFPYRVAVHRFIDGVNMDEVDPELRPELARTVGEALGAIHSTPLSAARDAGLAELDRGEPGRTAWFEGGSEGLRALRGRDASLDEAIEWAALLDDPLRKLDAPTRFIHHDVSPEHLLADPQTGRLCGIIDWTDAILGDPARDFVSLVTSGGWEFTDRVLAHYTHPVDPGFRERLRFMARLLPLMWLGHAKLREEDTEKHVSWVRNAFGR